MTQAQNSIPDEETVHDYDMLSREFERGLLDTLRGHGVGHDFLEYWVPDTDPAKGLVSMIESAGMAGFQQLRIRVSKSMLGDELANNLVEQLDVAEGTLVEVQHESMTLLLSISGILDPANSAAGQIKPSAVHVSLSQPSITDSTRVLGNIGGPDDLRAQFDAIAEEILKTPVHERSEANVGDSAMADDGMLFLEARSKTGAILRAQIRRSDDTLIAFSHGHGRDLLERAVLETFCNIATGKPVTESADHSGLHVIDQFIEQARDRMGESAGLIPGIVLPSNQPSVFASVITLIRDIRDQYEKLTGKSRPENNFAAGPDAAWLAMSDGDRMSVLESSTVDYLRGTNHAADSISVLRVEPNRTTHPVRVAVALSEASLSFEEKPVLIRMLEKWLRREVEPTLELIADRVVDESPLRRLGGSVTPSGKKTKKKTTPQEPTHKDVSQ